MPHRVTPRRKNTFIFFSPQTGAAIGLPTQTRAAPFSVSQIPLGKVIGLLRVKHAGQHDVGKASAAVKAKPSG
jgi:hypothetical protein